ncbi:hypothetical protein BB561_000344 [Smittium simulii]|uniref:Uncharacterized protein n=1 Tax=Smittium simulii TaxID=133385 RepID=A0A2T9YZJ4_9FUNG|nr:hypothetical protein BB561_000344 [Smittium simulii]
MAFGLASKIVTVVVLAIAALFYKERIMVSNYDKNPELAPQGRDCLNQLMNQAEEKEMKGFATIDSCVCTYKIKGDEDPDFGFYKAQLYSSRGLYVGSKFFKTTIENPNVNAKSEILIQVRCSSMIGYLSKLRTFI